MSIPPRWSVSFRFSKSSVSELGIIHLAEETDYLSFELYQPGQDGDSTYIYVFDNFGDAILFLSNAAYECMRAPPGDIISVELVDYEISE